MTSSLTGQVLAALSEYSSRTRLVELKFDDERTHLCLHDPVQALTERTAWSHQTQRGKHRFGSGRCRHGRCSSWLCRVQG